MASSASSPAANLANGLFNNMLASSSSSASAATSAQASTKATVFLDASSALDVLETYPKGDGLSLREMMDSQKNGGLTYNDFLMLPGRIDFTAAEVSLQSKWVGGVRLLRS